jgi:hypothetical protein
MGEIVKVNAGELKSFGDKMFAPNVVYQSAGIILRPASLFRYIRRG